MAGDVRVVTYVAIILLIKYLEAIRPGMNMELLPPNLSGRPESSGLVFHGEKENPCRPLSSQLQGVLSEEEQAVSSFCISVAKLSLFSKGGCLSIRQKALTSPTKHSEGMPVGAQVHLGLQVLCQITQGRKEKAKGAATSTEPVLQKPHRNVKVINETCRWMDCNANAIHKLRLQVL